MQDAVFVAICKENGTAVGGGRQVSILLSPRSVFVHVRSGALFSRFFFGRVRGRMHGLSSPDERISHLHDRDVSVSWTGTHLSCPTPFQSIQLFFCSLPISVRVRFFFLFTTLLFRPLARR